MTIGDRYTAMYLLNIVPTGTIVIVPMGTIVIAQACAI